MATVSVPVEALPRLLTIGLGWFPDQAGGLQRYLTDLTIGQLADRAAPPPRVVVIGPAAHAPAAVHPVGQGDQPLPLRLVRFAAEARRQAKQRDIVDSHFALYALPCQFVPRIRKLPLVVHFQGPWADEFVANGERPGWRIEVKRRLERSVYRRARAIVVLSDAFKRILVEQFGIAPDRVHVMWPAADVDRFTPGDKDEARGRLGVPGNAWVAVATRRLVARMGLDVLLDAWARLHDADRLLLVIGEGPEREPLERRAADLGLGATVRFLGRVSDDALVDAYRSADVSVVPTVALEGFGLVVLEALACGTPVIGTDVDGPKETLERFDPSCIVRAGDAAALARRLAAARRGDEPLPAPARCREFAASFSWPDIVRRHWELYAAVLRETRVPGRHVRGR
jgi:glycosyltransferase involved in cell wall biosynthesis